MVAKTKADSPAVIKKKIAAARTEADRRALVFQLKRAEKTEKAKPMAKAKTPAKKPISNTASKPKTLAKKETAKPKPAPKPKAVSNKKTAVKPKAVTKTKSVTKKSATKVKTVAKATVKKATVKSSAVGGVQKAGAEPKPEVKKPFAEAKVVAKIATKSKATSTKQVVKSPKKAAAETAPVRAKVVHKKTAAQKTSAKKAEVTKAKMVTENSKVAPETKQAVSGYGSGGVETVISVEEVTRQVAAIAEGAPVKKLEKLAGDDAYVTIENLHAGYGKMEILHDVSLRVGRKQSLCLIGPNGAGKSTVLHAIFGFNNIFSGAIKIGDGPDKKDVTKLSPNQKLSDAGIAYILQDKSVFPGMTVEENLWMGGFLKDQPAEAKRAAEQVFDKYPRLAARRKHLAKVLSGGERRLLEISRALVMDPEVLLVDEPSIGLEPRFIDMVFEILYDLQHTEGKTIIMVEQNAKKGLEFADIGYVLVNGEVAIADKGDELLANPKVGELFLGG